MSYGVVIPERVACIDVGAAYRGVRERIVELTTALSEQDWDQPVPHCPDWTVRQTVAHLSGIVDDALNGNMTGVATDAWTAVQVAKRADWTGPAIIEEWTTYAPFVDARVTEVGLGLAQLLFDAVNHEQDLRHALGRPGARDSDALWVAAHFVSANMSARIDAAGLDPVAIIVDGEPLTPPRPLELQGSVFDVVRAGCSRRSVGQIAALDWRGGVTREHYRLFNPFVPPSADIIE